jgi:hypothetical protein
VFLDGKDLGMTAFPAVAIPIGKHKIKLVNEGLKKEVTVDHEFKAGDTIFKYNFGD